MEDKGQQEEVQMDGMIQVLLQKNKGNQYFAKKEYKQALECYENAVKVLQTEIDNKKKEELQNKLSSSQEQKQNEKEKEKIEENKENKQNKQTDQKKIINDDPNMQLKCLLQNNIAAALLELWKYDEVVEICNLILVDFPKSIKAIFRRGVAHLQSHRFIEANNDLKLALSLNPGNPEILKVLDTANKRLQNPAYLLEVARKGGMKIQSFDPYIYDPQNDIKKDFKKEDKNFELQGSKNFNLSQAKQYRQKLGKSIDMLKRSVEEDAWTYIDKQVAEDFGFTKLKEDQWHLLFGIYQVLFTYMYLSKEKIDEARDKCQLEQLFKQKFDEQGWFKYEGRKIQCLYYKLYLESECQIN